MSLMITGIKVGLLVAMPVGPITIMCVRQSLQGNLGASMATTLAIGTANLFYTLVGALSFEAATEFLDRFGTAIESIGSIVILLIGLQIIRSRTQLANKKDQPQGVVRTYASILALTLTSPMTIMLFTTAFTGIETTAQLTEYSNLSFLTTGVLIASLGWFCFLSFAFRFLRQWLTLTHITWLNIGAGSFIIVYALQQLYALLA